MITALRRGLLVLLAVLPLFSHAALTAHQVIQKTTDELLADLKANKEQYRSDPAAFYDSLNEILGPVVDADGISRSIMTVKYSRNATPEQMKRFQENFKRSLMQFYGNALLEYNNQQIRVLPPSGKQDPAHQRRHGGGGAPGRDLSGVPPWSRRRMARAQRDHQRHQHRQAVPRPVRRLYAAQRR